MTHHVYCSTNCLSRGLTSAEVIGWLAVFAYSTASEADILIRGVRFRLCHGAAPGVLLMIAEKDMALLELPTHERARQLIKLHSFETEGVKA